MPSRFSPPVAPPAVSCQHRVGAGREARDRADRLAEFLTAIDEDAEAALSRIAGDLAVELVIALPDDVPLTPGHDLHNYLLPVVARLGQRRIPAVFGRKVHEGASALTLGPACVRGDSEPPMMRVRAAGDFERPGWKEQVWDACEASVAGAAFPAGRLCLDVALTVSSFRNWTSLWKPTIDALGPLLGVPSLGRPWSPASDRVVRIGLHRTVDDLVGHDVLVAAWWSEAGET